MAIWDDALDAITGIPGAIKRLVQRAIDTVETWAVDQVQQIIRWVTGWIVWIQSTFQHVWSYIWDHANQIAALIDRAWNALPAFVYQYVGGVFTWLSQLIDQVATDVVNAVRFIFAMRDWVLRWVIDNVLGPLRGAIANTVNWIQGTLVPWVLNLALTPVRELEAWVAYWQQWILEALNTGRVIVRDVLPLFRAAEHFLLFVARHPFTWWRILAEQVIDALPAVIERELADTRSPLTAALQRALGRWF